MKRILIVDDDQDTLALLETSLSEVCEVRTFDRGSAALAEIFAAYRDGWQFEVLLLDCALPYFDGFTIAKIVRMAEATGIVSHPTKIGFFTAYTRTVEQSTLLSEVGADRYFRKPEDIVQLPQLLAEWLMEAKCVTV